MNRKGPESVYDKWNISVVICDTYIPEWLSQINWQHTVHKTQDQEKTKEKNTTHYVLDTTIINKF
jgi:hypothetical protein